MEIFTPSDYQDDGTSTKRRRRRSTRPCDACRKRKTRCITDQTAASSSNGSDNGSSAVPVVCIHCRLRGTRCTYGEKTPDQLPVRHLDRERELTRDQRPETVTCASQSSGMPPVSPTVASEAPDRPWTLPEDNSTPTLGLMPTRFSELYGISSDMEPILMRHRPYDASTQEFCLETHSIRRVRENDGNGSESVEYPVTFHVVQDDKALAFDPEHTQACAVEDCVAPHGPRLVELFWRHIHPCYPILHKGIFMQLYQSPSRTRVIGPELLAAVYLSSLRWWSYDPELSIRDMPDSAVLRRLLYSALNAAYHRPRLSGIQAILLLLQCQPEDPLNPDHSFDWGLTCQALAIAQCLGLHLDAHNWSLPLWERQLRQRLSWALFLQDRWTALAYGRPVHIHLDDWAVPPLTEADFEDASVTAVASHSRSNNGLGSDIGSGSGGGGGGGGGGPGIGSDADLDMPCSSLNDRRSIIATGKTLFILMVQLAEILSDVLAAFYTARTSLDQDTTALYTRAMPLLERLQTWQQRIPASLQMHVSYQRKLSFHGHLHISYYGVQISLLRRLIRSTALPPRCTNDQVLSDIRQIALRTVQNAMAFVYSLRPDQLEAFWYFTSPYIFSLIGSFTTLLLVTSLSVQERGYWQETLNTYLWHLRTLSKSCEHMRYAVNRLEGAILRGLEHALAVNLHEPVDFNVSPPMIMTEAPASNQPMPMYTDFGAWDLQALNGSFDLLSAMQFPLDEVAGE